jgi:trimeric autotransporter adhesin
MKDKRSIPSLLAMLGLVFGALFAVQAGAQVAKQGNDVLSSLAFTSDKLLISQPVEPLDDVQSLVTPGIQNGWAAFRIGANAGWKASVDRRNGQISFAEGGGVGWVPGHGNALNANDIAAHLRGKSKPDLAVLESIARGYLPRVASLLGVDASSLVLDQGRSGQPAGHVWFVDFNVVREGLPVEGARVVFRVNNGNLVQFGTENLPSPGATVPPTRLANGAALSNLASFLGGFGAADAFLDGGSLHLLPANNNDPGLAEGFAFGNGRGIAKVWQFTFHRDGVMGTWRARVDAATGEVLELVDVNEYAQATGGVYMNSPTTGAEVVRAMPFTNLSTGGFANSAGVFSASGATSTLAGQYVRITDTCGAISQAADGSGNIVFGTSTGTDCTTPGHGGAGNTHSSRTQFYHVNRIKEVGRGWLPSNTWLNGQLTVNVNLNQTCNAYWNGSTLNFFKSGGGCGNTGEIAAVSLHEYGHGLDQNDGTGTAPEGGTGEAYGDTTAALQLHNSCIGPGFLTSNCGGYGDACTACTGVRDIDWAKHASNTPATVNGFTRTHCGAGSGPCGKEVHCESYVASETIWDLANRDLPNPGTGSAWTTTDRLWYLSRGTATSAFSCTTGATFTSNGCGTGSWWKTMRAVDDDDGNLTNGTPHSCNLFAAFNRHGIACTTDAGANTCFAGCTAPATPTLSLTAGANSVAVGLAGTGVFDVYRNELGCNNGFIKVANDVSGPTFNDTGVANGTTYFYQVVAHPSGNEACGSVPSTCQSATPTGGGTCTPPAAPTGLTATASGQTAINLSWTAVTGATEYHILRSTTSGGPYTQVGTATTTSFADSGLTCNTTYFYVVRAANSATCESGNSAQASATTAACTGCTTTTLYTNGFETGTGLADWTKGTFVSGGSTANWRGIQTCTAQTGSRIFRYGGSASCTAAYTSNDFTFAQPNGAAGIAVPAGSTTTRLTFGHRWGFESGFDGGTLTVSVDGTNYFFVPASAILSGSSYNGTISNACPPAGAAGASAFTGSQSTFVNTTVNLDAACNVATGTSTGCAGRSVRVGFTSITDCSVTSTGWFLDNVTVTACTP